ncbi:unnamed protein product, partial [Nezara viridula]
SNVEQQSGNRTERSSWQPFNCNGFITQSQLGGASVTVLWPCACSPRPWLPDFSHLIGSVPGDDGTPTLHGRTLGPVPRPLPDSLQEGPGSHCLHLLLLQDSWKELFLVHLAQWSIPWDLGPILGGPKARERLPQDDPVVSLEINTIQEILARFRQLDSRPRGRSASGDAPGSSTVHPRRLRSRKVPSPAHQVRKTSPHHTQPAVCSEGDGRAAVLQGDHRRHPDPASLRGYVPHGEDLHVEGTRNDNSNFVIYFI